MTRFTKWPPVKGKPLAYVKVRAPWTHGNAGPELRTTGRYGLRDSTYFAMAAICSDACSTSGVRRSSPSLFALRFAPFSLRT